jgi:hypothetical protein
MHTRVCPCLSVCRALIRRMPLRLASRTMRADLVADNLVALTKINSGTHVHARSTGVLCIHTVCCHTHAYAYTHTHTADDAKNYGRLAIWLASRVNTLTTPGKAADAFCALARAGKMEVGLFDAVVKHAEKKPPHYHMEHLLSMAR